MCMWAATAYANSRPGFMIFNEKWSAMLPGLYREAVLFGTAGGRPMQPRAMAQCGHAMPALRQALGRRCSTAEHSTADGTAETVREAMVVAQAAKCKVRGQVWGPACMLDSWEPTG